MHSLYFAELVEDSRTSFVLTQSSSIEEVQKGFDEETLVRAVHRVPLSEQEQQILDVLLGIDQATNTNVVEDLLARIFTEGSRT